MCLVLTHTYLNACMRTVFLRLTTTRRVDRRCPLLEGGDPRGERGAADARSGISVQSSSMNTSETNLSLFRNIVPTTSHCLRTSDAIQSGPRHGKASEHKTLRAVSTRSEEGQNPRLRSDYRWSLRCKSQSKKAQKENNPAPFFHSKQR